MIIYTIINTVNDKCYVGQTVRPFNLRLNSHLHHLRTNQHHSEYLQRSWNKYGEDAFEFKILEGGFETIDELNEAEEFWIRYLYTYCPYGYNMNYGGDNSLLLQSTKDKIRDASSIGVVQYTLKGEMVAIHDSAVAASKIVDSSSNNITACLTGSTLSAGGFQWKYLDDNPPNKIKAIKSTNERKGRSKKVARYTLEGDLVDTFDTINEACEEVDRHHHSICRACRDKGVVCADYQFRYYEDEPLEKIEPTESHGRKVNRSRMKEVIKCDLEGNELETYKDLYEAADSVDGYFNTIRMVCTGIYLKDNYKGFKWKYKK